ncbi:GNAT family N-acetyltransferase [Terrabacter aeriphilus]|uniref:GNAT family N-acetyltransferase n=1 Tax=Terrabacter aeriphilus TaxID=515662 RepID=A0ABP9JCT5_9MICO
MSDLVTYVDRLPTPGEHRVLAESVRWSHAFDWDTMEASLAGSIAGVVTLDGAHVIGMVRLVDDGVKCYYVQDIAVLPTFQGRGIGATLLQRLLERVARTAVTTAFVGLFATEGAASLYQRHGFTRGDMTSMFRLVPPMHA